MAQLRIDKKTKGIPSPWRPRPTNRKTTDDFNHAIFGCLGMQCTLDVALSDNTQVTDDVGGCLSKNVVLAVGQSWGGSHDHRISGMDTERIKVIHIRCKAFRQSNEPDVHIIPCSSRAASIQFKSHFHRRLPGFPPMQRSMCTHHSVCFMSGPTASSPHLFRPTIKDTRFLLHRCRYETATIDFCAIDIGQKDKLPFRTCHNTSVLASFPGTVVSSC